VSNHYLLFHISFFRFDIIYHNAPKITSLVLTNLPVPWDAASTTTELLTCKEIWSLNFWLTPWPGMMNQSCAVISYPSGQDGAVASLRDYALSRKIINSLWPSMFGHVWSIGLVHFCVFMDKDGVELHRPSNLYRFVQSTSLRTYSS